MLMIGSHIALLGRRGRSPLPLWMVGIKLALVLLMLAMTICHLVSLRYQERLREMGERCVTSDILTRPWYREMFATDDLIIEHHRPRHWDYGQYGSGDVCSPEDDHVPGVHGML